jgi:diaminopimelate epimerase
LAQHPWPPVPFTKVHGLGNDYLFLDGIAGALPEDLPALARAMSDRHFGPGADGIITLERGAEAPLRMRIWNADGSEAEMCGNGLRGFAKLAFERGYVRERTFAVETGAGVRQVTVFEEDGRVGRVRVDMGVPRLHRGAIPMRGPEDEEAREVPVEVAGATVHLTAVSMGNPHAVLWVEDVEAAPVATWGPALEHHPLFPRRVNVEFAQRLAADRVAVRTWERGSGETLACGTGACAVVVAGVLTGRIARRVAVVLRGGELEVAWAEDGHVHLTGPVVEVYTGVYAPR